LEFHEKAQSEVAEAQRSPSGIDDKLIRVCNSLRLCALFVSLPETVRAILPWRMEPEFQAPAQREDAEAQRSPSGIDGN
jgi:hypothetical protein